MQEKLDEVRDYRSERHYTDYRYLARRWVKRWEGCHSDEVTADEVRKFLAERKGNVSAHTANKELRYLRAVFNLGIKRGLISANPTAGIEFFPVERRLQRVPTPEEIDRVIASGTQEQQDYLWVIRESMARVSEVNQLLWDDVDLPNRSLVLYTRKKKGGHLTPRRVPMTERLFQILSDLFARRDPTKPWVFWHRYWSKKRGAFVEGPFKQRKRILKTRCAKTGVPYFAFHGLRRSGASLMDRHNVPIGSIQRILGHENRSTTEIYLYTMDDAEREAIATYERASRKSHPKSHP